MATVAPSSSTPAASRSAFRNIPRSTIIFSDLPPGVFLKSPSTGLSVADEIKLAVLNYKGSPDTMSRQMRYFSPLASLQRIVIVLKEESLAREVYALLRASPKFAQYKTNLSATLIRAADGGHGASGAAGHGGRSLSPDPSSKHLGLDAERYAPLDTNFTNNGKGSTRDLQYDSFIANYEEPIPRPSIDGEGQEAAEAQDQQGFAALDSNPSASSVSVNSTGSSSTRTLLRSLDLKIDTSRLDAQEPEAQREAQRRHSAAHNDGLLAPSSPSITLDSYEL